jgi:hypothetical protein
MRIKIVIRCSPIDPFSSLPRIATLARQALCFIGHHRSEIHIREGEMALRCARCGWRSPGWKIGLSARNQRPHAY